VTACALYENLRWQKKQKIFLFFCASDKEGVARGRFCITRQKTGNVMGVEEKACFSYRISRKPPQ